MESAPFTNLTQHRSDADAWKARGYWSRLSADRIAVSLASIAGLVLGVYGATRRRADPGVWWLISGTVVGCAAASLATRLKSEPPRADLVTQESVDSFPASDAPSSNATTATVAISSREP
jgi:hypothetical protein